MGDSIFGDESQIRVGDVLAGKFRVERVLGQGGMGVVVQAKHLHLDEHVALKFMLPKILRRKELVARFLREARAAVKLRSQHVARVLDVGTLDNGAPYIVMEYLEGSDLAQLVQRRGQLPPGEAVQLVLQACIGMAESHSRGIVHRDLKPENLFLTAAADGKPLIKILDFGISKAAVAADSKFATTASGSMMGSPAYMSPEQMRSSKDVDHRTDVWALGAILYHLLAGRPPYEADTIHSLIVSVLKEAPAPLDEAGRLPPGLVDVVARCLDKDVSTRYQNVMALVADLAPFAPVFGPAAVSAVKGVFRAATNPRDLSAPGPMSGIAPTLASDPGPPTQADTTLSASAAESAVLARRRAPWKLAAAAAAAVGVVAAIALAAGAVDGDAGRAVRPATSPPPEPSAASPGPAHTSADTKPVSSPLPTADPASSREPAPDAGVVAVAASAPPRLAKPRRSKPPRATTKPRPAKTDPLPAKPDAAKPEPFNPDDVARSRY